MVRQLPQGPRCWQGARPQKVPLGRGPSSSRNSFRENNGVQGGPRCLCASEKGVTFKSGSPRPPEGEGLHQGTMLGQQAPIPIGIKRELETLGMKETAPSFTTAPGSPPLVPMLASSGGAPSDTPATQRAPHPPAPLPRAGTSLSWTFWALPAVRSREPQLSELLGPEGKQGPSVNHSGGRRGGQSGSCRARPPSRGCGWGPAGVTA